MYIWKTVWNEMSTRKSMAYSGVEDAQRWPDLASHQSSDSSACPRSHLEQPW